MTALTRFTPAGLLGALRRLCHVGWTKKWGRTIPRHRRRLESLVRLERLEPRMLLAVDIVDLGANVDLAGLGIDPTTGDVTMVGMETVDGEEVAKVYYLSGDRTSVSSEALTGLPDFPQTIVSGISSDGSSIAGYSSNANQGGSFEGLFWDSSAPESAIGIGFLRSDLPESQGLGAFEGGVVGQHGGSLDGIRFSVEDGLVALEDNLSISTAFAASLDGTIVVGFSSAFRGDGGSAVYWDDSGVHELDNPTNSTGSIASSVSPSGRYVGGYQPFLEFVPFSAGEQATTWQKGGDNYEQTLLTWSDGSRVVGRVLGFSDSGYAVGSLTSGEGFIWHSSFDEPQIFDDWIAESRRWRIALPTPSTAVVGVVEDVANNKLAFSVNGGAYFVQVDLNETDEPNVNVVSFSEDFIAVGQGYDRSLLTQLSSLVR